MEGRSFGQWLMNELAVNRWTLQMLADTMAAFDVHCSDEYLTELCDDKRQPCTTVLQAIESVFGKFPGSLTHTTNDREELLWRIFNELCPSFPSLPYGKLQMWEIVRGQVGARDMTATALREHVYWILEGLGTSSNRQAIGACSQCGAMLFPGTIKCRCGLMYGAES